MEEKGSLEDSSLLNEPVCAGKRMCKVLKAKTLIKFPSLSMPTYKNTRLLQSLPKPMFPDFLIVKMDPQLCWPPSHTGKVDQLSVF